MVYRRSRTLDGRAPTLVASGRDFDANRWIVGVVVAVAVASCDQVQDSGSPAQLRFVVLSDNVAAYSAIGSYGIIGLCT